MGELERIAREVFEERFPEAELVSVTAEHREDHDGDPIVKITFVFRSETEKLDPTVSKGLIRYLREPLAKINETAFPVISTIAYGDKTGEAA